MKLKNKRIIFCLIMVLMIALTGNTGVLAFTGGSDIIIAETTDGSITPAPEDEPEPPSIIIQDYPATMTVGETTRLSYKLNNTDTDDVSWKSNDSDVLSVDGDGNVTANAPGSAKITASADGASDSVTINVKQAQAESIKIVSDQFGMTDSVTGYKMDKGDIIKLSIEVKPDDAAVPDVDWEVDDPEVAEIDSDGNLTALGNGKVMVTATADNGNLTDSIEVQVGSSIPWLLIVIIVVIVAIIVVLIVLIVKQRKNSKGKPRKSGKYDENDDDDDEDDIDDDDDEKKKQDDLEKEKERIRREAYLQGFSDRDKEMTKVFDPKDFESRNKDDDIE